MENIPKVLVVEDNLLAQKIACQMLMNQGFEVDAVETGKEAVRLAEIYDYTFIVLDFGLPDIMGDVVVRTIRADETKHHKPACPITILSASVDEIQVAECFALGVNQVFAKPLTIEIIEKIKKAS